MQYLGYLALVLASLIASVFVEGSNLFSSAFFGIAYATMSVVLVVGAKRKESTAVDFFLGSCLIFAVAFLSTETLIKIIAGQGTATMVFKLAILAALDYCAIGFLRLGRVMKLMGELKRNDRYGIYKTKKVA